MSRYRVGNHSPLMLIPHMLVQGQRQKAQEQLSAWCGICDAPTDRSEVVDGQEKGRISLSAPVCVVRVECKGEALAALLGDDDDRARHAKVTHLLRTGKNGVDFTDAREVFAESETEDMADSLRRSLRIPFFANAHAVTDVRSAFGADATLPTEGNRQ